MLSHLKALGRGRTAAAPAAPADLIAGRVLLAGGDEFACQARMHAPDQAEIIADFRPAVQQTAVCALDNIGVIHGKVVEIRTRGFIVAFALKEERREKLAAQLEWHARTRLRAVELERAPRIVPLHRAVEVRIAETVVVQGTILNISMSGAAITLVPNFGLFVGSLVRVGARVATVVRVIDGGVAVQFVEPFTQVNFDERVRP